jgi:hypothetical protein
MFALLSPLRRTVAASAAFVACLAGSLALAPDASAQRAYYYGPPGVGPRRYYDEREPLYATVIAVDGEGAIPVNPPQLASGNMLSGGAGFKARIGEQIRAGFGVYITPEVGYGYDHLFASDSDGNAYSWDTHRVFGGGRIALGHVLQPVVYGHIGYGWRETGDPTVPDAEGLAYDVGGALDLHLIPRFVIGAHVEYAAIEAQPDGPDWVAIGAHMQLLF